MDRATKRQILDKVETAARLMTWADVKIAHTHPEGWGELLAQVKRQEELLTCAKWMAKQAGISDEDVENAECKGTNEALDAAHEAEEEWRWDD